jgi:hypothetical protein
MYDLHHIPDKGYSKHLIKNYTVLKGVCIALPPNEHYKIRSSKLNPAQILNARSLLFLEILRLRYYTTVPVAAQIDIIETNKKTFPEAFKRSKK